MSEISTFEIRESIDGFEPGHVDSENGCDGINRMVIVIGNIPFIQFFTAPLGEIAGLMKDNLTNIPEPHKRLFPALEVVRERLESLSGVRDNFRTLLDAEAKSKDVNASVVLDSLVAHEILLPRPTGQKSKDIIIAEAIARLIEPGLAQTFTYRSIFETAKCEENALVSDTVVAAIEVGALPQYYDYYCCSCDRRTCICSYNQDRRSHCNISAGRCTVGSTSCPRLDDYDG